MFRTVAPLFFAVGLASTAVAQPQDAGKHEHHTGKQESVTLTGELVDTYCYMWHDGKGVNHAGCATKCINSGMPMGLVTGDGTLYLVTMDHDNQDPYNQLKTMAGKTLAVTGQIVDKGGLKAIAVASSKPIATK